NVNETQHIAEQDRNQRPEGRQARSMWRLHLQYHDGDDDGENAVSKGFQAPFIHSSYPHHAPALATPESCSAGVCALEPSVIRPVFCFDTLGNKTTRVAGEIRRALSHIDLPSPP